MAVETAAARLEVALVLMLVVVLVVLVVVVEAGGAQEATGPVKVMVGAMVWTRMTRGSLPPQQLWKRPSLLLLLLLRPPKVRFRACTPSLTPPLRFQR